MAGCLFCAIAAGDIPSAKLWEDARTFAFLDIRPLRLGHALVVPKTHATRLEEADPEDATAVMSTVARVTAALTQATGDPDATIAINNGPGAGQEVPHLHVHIVPRSPDDELGPIHELFPDRPGVTPDELARLAANVRAELGGR